MPEREVFLPEPLLSAAGAVVHQRGGAARGARTSTSIESAESASVRSGGPPASEPAISLLSPVVHDPSTDHCEHHPRIPDLLRRESSTGRDRAAPSPRACRARACPSRPHRTRRIRGGARVRPQRFLDRNLLRRHPAVGMLAVERAARAPRRRSLPAASRGATNQSLPNASCAPAVEQRAKRVGRLAPLGRRSPARPSGRRRSRGTAACWR